MEVKTNCYKELTIKKLAIIHDLSLTLKTRYDCLDRWNRQEDSIIIDAVGLLSWWR